jgi:hypothetical protein
MRRTTNIHHICGVIVSVFSSCAVDRGFSFSSGAVDRGFSFSSGAVDREFETRSGKTKAINYEIGISFSPIKHSEKTATFQ